MAIEKVIKIDVDQVKAMGGLEAFKQSLTQTEEKSQSLKAELAQLKKQLATLDEGTEQYQTIAKRAGEVSDKIGDINTKIKNLGSDTKNIDAVVQGAQTLSGAFSVASSASALLGSENEDLQKTMMKVESAIGLTVGIQSIANALQKESALAIGIANVATKVQTGLQVAYAVVVGTTTGALKALRVALVSTGVGALVVALGYLISKMSESSDATEEMSEKQKELNKELEYTKELTEDEAKRIDYLTQTALANAKKRGASDKELTKIQIEGIVARNKANIDEINAIKATQQNEWDLTKEQHKRIQDLRNQNIDLQRQGRLLVANFEADQAIKQRDLEQKNAEDAKKRRKELNNERRRELEEQRKKDLEDLRAFQKLMWDTHLENVADEAVQKKQEDEDKLKRLKEIGDASDAIDKEFNDKEIARAQAVASSKQAIREAELQAIDGGINLLKSLAGKSKALQATALIAESAVGIAKIIMNTQTANAAVTAKYALIPGGVALATAEKTLNRVNAGIGIATNLVALKSGLSALGGGGGSSARSGGGGGSESTPPSFNIVGQNPNNQLAQSIAQQQQQPLQAYVVSGNVTSAQSLDRNKIDTATFN